MSLPVELLSGADAELQAIFNRFIGRVSVWNS
jgi:hypothetical protein